jgi:anthranilate synthase component I
MPDRMKIIRDIDDNGVLVVQGLSCDTVTPVGAYMAFVGDAQGFLLESVPVAYSFVGRFDQGGMTVIEEGQGDPWSSIPVVSRPLKFNDNGLPPFIGGHVGYIGYDMVRGVEVLPRPQRASGFPDAMLGKASTVLVFDHLKQELRMLRAIPEPGISDREASTRARHDFQEIEEALSSGVTDVRPQMPRFKGVREVSLSDTDFTGAVLAAKDYLRRGDIMQVVLSRRLRIDIEGHPFDIYRRLRRINPSPYLFHIKLGDVTLIGSSPEEMVRLQGDAITTVPIAGTRPRGRNDREDDELAQDLLGDDKERAEHLMLLDLARNDLGRVSIPGSINVVQREKVRFYSHVMHIVSCVEGKRRPGINAVDVLKACFPAGTVSGAPKVRALEIIDELEGRCRGPYAGAVGYLSFNGTMDTGIVIRTIFARAGRTYLQAGAGIVWDSTPEREMREIDSKLKALQTALGGIA